MKDEYTEIREEYLADAKDKRFVTLEKARENKLKLNWKTYQPVIPTQLGIIPYLDFPLETLVPYIDWNPVFATWKVQGKYPNRFYPKIFDDPHAGDQARKLFDNAQKML